jgi:catechol 2,3-dioxygenase-like lactoylglutathione lyase family enzyme
MIRGSPSHIDLTVTDLKGSVDFYDRVLGRLGYRRLDEVGAGAPAGESPIPLVDFSR